MKQQWTYSLFRGLGAGAQSNAENAGAGTRLVGSKLEQAYRDLLLENQVLTESNRRLHDRLVHAENGLVDTPASRQLIRAQRNALIDRSRELREQQYANKTLQREHQQLKDSNRRMAEKLAKQAAAAEAMKRQLASSLAEAESLKQELTQSRRKEAMLTDRYYQLQARLDPALSADRVVKVDF